MANLKEISGKKTSPLALLGGASKDGKTGDRKSRAAWWVSALAFAVLLGLMLPTLFSPGLKAAPANGGQAKSQAGNADHKDVKNAKALSGGPLAKPDTARPFESGLSGDDYKVDGIEPPSLSDVGTKLVMAMGIMLILGSGLVVIAKKLTMGPLAGKSAGKLQLVDTLSLGRRCELHLVEIDGTRVLIGIDPTGMKSLISLPEEFRDVAERGEEAATQATAMQPHQGAGHHSGAAFAAHWPGPAEGPNRAT